MAKVRMYEVTAHVPGEEDERVYLVEATGQAAARKHVADKFVSNEVALADGTRVAVLMGQGVKPEKAKEEE